MSNPIVEGWYADPESKVFGDKVYIYVTKSLPFEEQQNIDLVVSEDLETFKITKNILDMSTYSGVEKAVWAPSVIEKSGKYYIIFAANDIHYDDEPGGLFIGVSDSPEGPFRNVYEDGRPFLNRFYNGAQPIDAHFYKEGNDVYLYYGGWRHLNVCKMNDEMNGLQTEIMEITPEDYVEAPCLVKIGDTYILMYSSGKWRNATYCVKTAISNSPYGPFVYDKDVLAASELADGPGHNSYFYMNDKHYVSYHRRIPGDLDSHHRKLCIDEISINNERMEPITMT